jgi:hypothetical protein
MLTRFVRLAVSVVVIGLVIMAGSAYAVVITNPSFEADGDVGGSIGYGWGGTYTGWTPGGDTFDFGGTPVYLSGVLSTVSAPQNGVADNGVTPDGTHVAFLQNYSNVSHMTFSTTVTGLSVGLTYQLKFYENARVTGYDPQDTSVTINGATIVASHSVSAVDPQGVRSTPYRLVTSSPFTAAAGSEVLTFISQRLAGDTSSDSAWLIDNLQITAVATPEPSVMALLATGLISLMAYAWRRRRA